VVNELLLVFLRQPELGEVKTRLGKVIGKHAALQAYRVMVEHVVDMTDRLAREHLQRVFWVLPPDGVSAVARWLGEHRRYLPQRGKDLGERLHVAFEHAFTHGASRVIAIGTDCVELDAEHVENAFTCLETSDAVLGPTEDGGYYLIGMRKLISEAFEDIPWSTAGTAQTTRQRLNAAAATLSHLPVLRDIDTVGDLNRAGATVASLRDLHDPKEA